MLCKKPPGTHSGNSTETKSIESQNQIKQQDKSFLAKPQLCCAHAICVSSNARSPNRFFMTWGQVSHGWVEVGLAGLAGWLAGLHEPAVAPKPLEFLTRYQNYFLVFAQIIINPGDIFEVFYKLTLDQIVTSVIDHIPWSRSCCKRNQDATILMSQNKNAKNQESFAIQASMIKNQVVEKLKSSFISCGKPLDPFQQLLGDRRLPKTEPPNFTKHTKTDLPNFKKHI